MEQKKRIFMLRIMILNLIQPFACSTEYFDRYFAPMAHGLAASNPRHSYAQIVKIGKYRFGWTGVLCANAALLWFCLPLSIASDYCVSAVFGIAARLLIDLVCLVIMLEKFDILYLRDGRNLLKLLYVSYTCFSANRWTATCLFLAVFDNIMF